MRHRSPNGCERVVPRNCPRAHPMVGLWHRHSATAKFVEKPSREPRNAIDTHPQRVRAQRMQSDHMLFRPVWVGYRLVLWHDDSSDSVLPALRFVRAFPRFLGCRELAADRLQLAHGVDKFRVRDCGRGRVRNCGRGRVRDCGGGRALLGVFGAQRRVFL